MESESWLWTRTSTFVFFPSVASPPLFQLRVRAFHFSSRDLKNHTLACLWRQNVVCRARSLTSGWETASVYGSVTLVTVSRDSSITNSLSKVGCCHDNH